MNSTAAPQIQEHEFSTAIATIYSFVLLTGTISLSLMMHIMKSSSTSSISLAILNLIFAHFIFLFTLPFRIYYYSTLNWKLGEWWCKVVSAMIHIHMYMSFIFYVIILILRLVSFHFTKREIGSFQTIPSLLVSALVWVVMLVVVPCIKLFYGHTNESNSTTTCFGFGKDIESFKEINYIISTLIILVALVLTALQVNVLRILYRTHGKGCSSQQDFWAQLMSLCFALIMVLCFVPYHIFRLYYLEHIYLENMNDLFLSLTTFNCLDMLTFLGRRTFHGCFRRFAV